ncbi:MAG: LysM peptidoglycan-binding domain-containing protein [Verrucomicrobiota bacterium]|jgi:LysM repeat protein
MNTISPLVPQGTTPPRGKSSLYFKILMILGVHVVLIGGMLLQGCKDTTKESGNSPNSTEPGYASTSNIGPETLPPVTPAALSNQFVAQQPATPQPAIQPVAPQPQPAVAPAAPMAPAAEGREYVIAAGDTLGAIARRNHLSLKAMMDANPGVDAKKLRIGQKVQIPGATAAVAATPGAAPAPEAVAAEGSVYVVKTGDTLGKIARAHGTSFKKLMAVNDLKTTSIRVGQKLKMPAPKPAGTEAIPASASTAQPLPAASPMPVSTAAAPAPAPAGVAN